MPIPWIKIALLNLALCISASALAQPASTGSGQAFPTKPIRWISPFAAGGGADLTTRLMAQRISEVVGQPIVIDNRIGASGNIGTEIAARAAGGRLHTDYCYRITPAESGAQRAPAL